MYFHLNIRHADKNSASGNNHIHPRTEFSMWTTLLHKQECLLWIYKSFTGRDLPSASLRSRKPKIHE